MDLNRFKGTAQEFDARYGTHIEYPDEPPVEPPVVIIPIKYVYVTAGSLNMRSAPGDLSPQADIGTLRYGSDVPVIEEKDGWYRIEGWISSAYTRAKK